jgi:DNA mismatch repair protein MutH
MQPCQSSGYDPTSVDSIYEFSLRLVGKSLSSIVELPRDIENLQDRGNLGSLVEKYFFKLDRSNTAGPDFSKARLELKTTGLRHDKGSAYSAKERLKLGSINYNEIVNEQWSTSTLLKKIGNVLIMFYEYDEKVKPLDRIFVASILYKIPEVDAYQIQRDWEKIRETVRQGRAHELSEGDTRYLGACRSGTGGYSESLRKQPNSEVDAKSRAFCFKQSYLNSIFQGNFVRQGSGQLEQFVSLGASRLKTLEDATFDCFKPFFGKSVEELTDIFGISSTPKNYRRALSERILGGSEANIDEIRKSGVELKTIKLGASWTPRESISFRNFDYFEIAQQSWDDSELKNSLEKEFLFIIFRQVGLIERLESIVYWTMPFEDRERAREVWEVTKRQILDGKREFTKASERKVIHVRPKAANASVLVSTPKSGLLGKKCFWINANYIGQQLEDIFT